MRAGAALAKNMRDSCGQHAGLAGARAGQHEKRAVDRLDRCPLLGVQPIEIAARPCAGGDSPRRRRLGQVKRKSVGQGSLAPLTFKWEFPTQRRIMQRVCIMRQITWRQSGALRTQSRSRPPAPFKLKSAPNRGLPRRLACDLLACSPNMQHGIAKTLQFWPRWNSVQPQDHQARTHQAAFRPNGGAAQGRDELGQAGPPSEFSQGQGDSRPGRIHTDGASSRCLATRPTARAKHSRLLQRKLSAKAPLIPRSGRSPAAKGPFSRPSN